MLTHDRALHRSILFPKREKPKPPGWVVREEKVDRSSFFRTVAAEDL